MPTSNQILACQIYNPDSNCMHLETLTNNCLISHLFNDDKDSKFDKFIWVLYMAVSNFSCIWHLVTLNSRFKFEKALKVYVMGFDIIS